MGEPERRHSVAGQVVRGAIAGAIATWLMDQVTTALMQSQSEAETQREQAIRPNGKSSVENLLDRVLTATGFHVDEQSRPLALQATHYALGVVPGALYAVLRDRLPLVGALRGIVYGLLVWAVNDEYLNSRLGLAAPIEAYPPGTHLRGLVGHVVLGVATDTAIDVLGG